ncbi:MAG: hypothetical protein H0T47_14665 [Planctomycetaceae bacterium]|nr:hypothetical protein [Planctomycetaceae bacterium]
MVSIASGKGRSKSRYANSDELTRVLGAELRHLVTDLSISARDKAAITVTGRSKSYHGKQLATHALFTAVPGVEIRNDITVCTGPDARGSLGRDAVEMHVGSQKD